MCVYSIVNHMNSCINNILIVDIYMCVVVVVVVMKVMLLYKCINICMYIYNSIFVVLYYLSKYVINYYNTPLKPMGVRYCYCYKKAINNKERE